MLERRAKYEEQSGFVDHLIVEGTARTRKEVQETVFATRKAMGLAGAFNQIRRKAERSGRTTA
jgi:tryptophanyl-tRNA synthetase